MDNKVVDHRGYLFNSINEMCKHWNIPRSTYNYRIASGWSIEDVLTKPAMSEFRPIPCKDHLGNNYKSISEMCNVYGVNPRTYVCRIKNGWDIERALKEKVHDTSPSDKIVKSFEGLEFKSKMAMCKHYGICKTTYYRRIKAGFDQRASLLIPSGVTLSTIFKPSMAIVTGETEYYATTCPFCNKKMIESKLSIVEHFIKHGREKDPINIIKYTVFNKNYESLTKLCLDLSITRSALQRKLKRGDKLEDAVLDCMKNKRKRNHTKNI
ncbi:hypothetical protein PIROE2DRAFT_64422 [Piromyces sp. E2]|nr:hypothetical protein PIROE2DRAFT_64422 [Piromyces sp. E2]|eukprot:OUM58418.1 hypothetical protein PIROE2DRAFT_64422 [Piromyces sp. E2]